MNQDQKLKQFHRNRDIYWLAAGSQFVVAVVFGWIAWKRADVFYASVAVFALIAGAACVWRIQWVAKAMAHSAEAAKRAGRGS